MKKIRKIYIVYKWQSCILSNQTDSETVMLNSDNVYTCFSIYQTYAHLKIITRDLICDSNL
jgi:hypothetical protein